VSKRINKIKLFLDDNSNFPNFSDSNTLVEAVEFATLGKIQPFLVTITTSAALLIDFHCHLTKNEVCGYLGGSWDVNSHSKITKLTTNWNEINLFLFEQHFSSRTHFLVAIHGSIVTWPPNANTTFKN
jgi:hypothetical protein